MKRHLGIALLILACSQLVLGYGSGTADSTHRKLVGVLFDAAAPPNLANLVLAPAEYRDLYKFRQIIVDGADSESSHYDPADSNTNYWFGNESQWENVIRASQYPTKSFSAAYRSVGYIVHLTQDSTIPAHDRVIFHGPPTLYRVAPGGALLDGHVYTAGRSDGVEFAAKDFPLNTLVPNDVSLAAFHASPGTWSNTAQYYNSSGPGCQNVNRKLWLCSGEAASADHRDDYAGLCGPPQSRTWGVYSFPTASGCAYPQTGADLDWYPRRLTPSGGAEAPQSAHDVGRAAVYLAIRLTSENLKRLSRSLPPLVTPPASRVAGAFASGGASSFAIQIQENRTQAVSLTVRDAATGRAVRAAVTAPGLTSAAIDLDGSVSLPLSSRADTDLTTLPWADSITLTWDGSLAGGTGRIGAGDQSLDVEVRDGDGNVGIARILVNAGSAGTPPPSTPPQTVTLIPTGSAWNYLDTGADLGSGWTARAYNDAAWKSGRAQLGYGDGDEATTVGYGPNAAARYITTYFRRAFTVADPAAFTGLGLRLMRDDGAVVYLNGTEVFRSNMPAGTVTATTMAATAIGSPEESAWFTGSINPALLVAGTNVIAVEIHQGAADSSDISFDFALSASGTGLPPAPAAVVRGPYVQLGTPDSMTLRWRTDLATASYVEFGLSPTGLSWIAGDPAATTDHTVVLQGLLPDTTYYYAVGTGTSRLAGGDATYAFVTSPRAGTPKPTRFWVLGDSGTADANAAAVRNGYQAWAGASRTDFWLMTGDNAYDSGTDAEYQAGLFDMYPTTLRTSVLWPTLGNHDAISSPPATQSGPYFSAFVLPSNAKAGGVASGTEAYYAFDYGNIHVVVLDSSGSDRRPGQPMATWLQNDLAQNTLPWVIAVFHHAPYSNGSVYSDTEPTMTEMRESLLPILEGGGVDLVLSGHSHGYERSFLINGHYGYSASYQPSIHLKAGGSGREDGGGVYRKPAGVPQAGTVYAIIGSSGEPGNPAPRDYPAMFMGTTSMGSLVIDVNGLRLDAAFVDEQGIRRDYFTISKDPTPPPVPTAPAAPSNLAAAAPSAARVDLSWADNAANETGFELQRASDGVTFAPLVTLPASSTSYADTAVSPATTYTYRVRAIDAVGPSSWAGSAQATTPAAAPQSPTLVAAGAVWKYLDTGVDPGTAWKDPAFADTAWASGAAELGYGDGDEATTVRYGSDANAKYITTYFRRTFTVTDPKAWSALTMRLVRDDGAIVYLNGVEVYRSNMPAGTVTSTTLASYALAEPDESAWLTSSISSARLVAGSNVIAVEIHQGTVDSSDISFNLELTGVAAGTTPPPATPPAAPGNLAASAQGRTVVALTWRDNSADETGFQIQRSTNGTSFTNVASVGPNVSAYSVTGLKANTTYYFRVTALRDSLSSPPSNTASVKTLR